MLLFVYVLCSICLLFVWFVGFSGTSRGIAPVHIFVHCDVMGMTLGQEWSLCSVLAHPSSSKDLTVKERFDTIIVFYQ